MQRRPLLARSGGRLEESRLGGWADKTSEAVKTMPPRRPRVNTRPRSRRRNLSARPMNRPRHPRRVVRTGCRRDWGRTHTTRTERCTGVGTVESAERESELSGGRRTRPPRRRAGRVVPADRGDDARDVVGLGRDLDEAHAPAAAGHGAALDVDREHPLQEPRPGVAAGRRRRLERRQVARREQAATAHRQEAARGRARPRLARWHAPRAPRGSASCESGAAG